MNRLVVVVVVVAVVVIADLLGSRTQWVTRLCCIAMSVFVWEEYGGRGNVGTAPLLTSGKSYGAQLIVIERVIARLRSCEDSNYLLVKYLCSRSWCLRKRDK